MFICIYLNVLHDLNRGMNRKGYRLFVSMTSCETNMYEYLLFVSIVPLYSSIRMSSNGTAN